MAQLIHHLTFRAGVVIDSHHGYLLACDPDKEASQPHVYIMTWTPENTTKTSEPFNAHTVCRITVPQQALVFMSTNGKFAIYSDNKNYGNVFENGQPQPVTTRYGDIRSLKAINGKAYAVGFGGAVYRLDTLSNWTRIDNGLPEDFDIEAIDGFSNTDIYAGGFCGQLWHYNGQSWTKCEIPSNVTINSICCAHDATVYLAGNDGIVIHGREDCWNVWEQDDMTDDIWDVVCFTNNIYFATLSDIYRLNKDHLERVDFGDAPPKSTYRLSTANGLLWSIGEFTVTSFDGTSWTLLLSSE